jgi:hypothetical protein
MLVNTIELEYLIAFFKDAWNLVYAEMFDSRH